MENISNLTLEEIEELQKKLEREKENKLHLKYENERKKIVQEFEYLTRKSKFLKLTHYTTEKIKITIYIKLNKVNSDFFYSRIYDLVCDLELYGTYYVLRDEGKKKTITYELYTDAPFNFKETKVNIITQKEYEEIETAYNTLAKIFE